MADRSDLDPLFAPESVAVVGASPDSWYSSQLMDNLLDYGFDGDVYPVNPSRDEAWGRTCHDALSDVPEVVDLAVVSVPRDYVVGVLEEAGGTGVPAALVITAGFAEADERGAELQAELAAVAEEYDLRICGPNCIGLANAGAETVLTSTCSRKPEPGSIGLASHSGAMAFTTFFERAADEDVHFSHVVSTGNEADQTLTDYVEYMGERGSVDVVCTYIEGLDEPRRFMRVADGSARKGTPVLSIKVGRSETGEAAAVSHTGSLTGDDDAWEAAFRQSGVERVGDVPDLLGRARAHAAFDPPASNHVCVASTSGGLASLLADMAGGRDLELPDLAGESEQALLDMEDLLTFDELHNPIDIRGYGADVLPEIAEALFADDAYDAYVFAIGLSAVDERAETIAEDLLTVSEMAEEPVFFLWTGRKEAEAETEAKAEAEGPLPFERVREEVPLYYDPGRCMDALTSLVRFGEHRRRTADRPALADLATEPETNVDLPEDRLLTWEEAEPLLAAHGVEPVDTRLVEGAGEAARAGAELGFPVVLKVDSPDVAHRNRIDAVKTGVASEEEAREAYDSIVESVRRNAPDATVSGVLVQPEVEEGVEALVGVSPDESFGSLVTVGSGGTLVEAMDDGALLVPPFAGAEVKDALAETRLADRLDDGDADALVDLVERIGRLAADERVREVDLNPVIVRDGEVSVVDLLVRT